MDEMSKGCRLGVAALRSGVHRNTARRYLESGRLPSEGSGPRTWRTREDPFAADWEEVSAQLEALPEVEARALFEALQERRPGRYEDGQVRTFQRRVKQWRAEQGPGREILLPQDHRPGEALQTDFTEGSSLGVTVDGAAFRHLLCDSVLPYSNWQSIVVCRSESMLALRSGIQEALFRLGRVPEWHQTDNSTAATHDLRTGRRGFNAEYEELMAHWGMKPRTIAIGASRQNGDVEAANGALKRRLVQRLLLRGSRDFATVSAYESWVGQVIDQANAVRKTRLAEELAVMTPLTAGRLPRYREIQVRVTSNGTIRVQKNTYSVPSRLRGERLTVRRFDLHLEVYYQGKQQLATERLSGEGKHRVDYRHVVGSLVKKPWGFARYRYRDALFPTEIWHQAYARLTQGLSERRADLEYLRVLHLASTTLQHEVEAAITRLLAEDKLPIFVEVQALVSDRKPEVPCMAPWVVDLKGYDELLLAEVQP